MECIESHELIKPYQNLYFEPIQSCVAEQFSY